MSTRARRDRKRANRPAGGRAHDHPGEVWQHGRCRFCRQGAPGAGPQAGSHEVAGMQMVPRVPGVRWSEQAKSAVAPPAAPTKWLERVLQLRRGQAVQVSVPAQDVLQAPDTASKAQSVRQSRERGG